MRWISVIISLLLVATAIFGIYQVVVLFSNINNQKNGVKNESSGSVIFICQENITQSSPCFGLEMITRHEWTAQPPLNPIDKLDLPASNIILTDTKTEECFKKSKCNLVVRTLQDEHTLWNDDIAYNFLISSQGDIYEGRGWLLQSLVFSEDLKRNSYWIGLMGNFSVIPVPQLQVTAVQHLITHAQSVGKLNSIHTVFCSTELLFLHRTSINDSMITAEKYQKCFNKY